MCCAIYILCNVPRCVYVGVSQHKQESKCSNECAIIQKMAVPQTLPNLEGPRTCICNKMFSLQYYIIHSRSQERVCVY